MCKLEIEKETLVFQKITSKYACADDNLDVQYCSSRNNRITHPIQIKTDDSNIILVPYIPLTM